MLEKLFKDLLLKESEAFNEMYAKLLEEKRKTEILYKTYYTLDEIGYNEYRNNYSELVRYVAVTFKKYGDYVEDLIEDYPHNYILEDEYILNSINDIIKYRENCKKAFKTNVKLHELTDKIKRLQHLNADMFYYSALEAIKDIVPENRIYYDILEEIGYPRFQILQSDYTFPHNIESNIRSVDKRLYEMFKYTLNRELIKPVHEIREYKPLIINY